MVNKSVYLAGPIAGLTFDDADEWRIKARKFLTRHGIDGMSPLRGKQYLRALGELSATCGPEGKAGILSKPRSLTQRDFFDVRKADVVLVNLLGATRISIGTVMELAWAYQLQTPCVCCIEDKGNVHEHAMVGEAIGFRVPTLEEGLAVCVAILSPTGT